MTAVMSEAELTKLYGPSAAAAIIAWESSKLVKKKYRRPAPPPKKKNPASSSRRVEAARGLFKSFTGRPGKPAGYIDLPEDDVIIVVGNCEAIAYNAVRGGRRQSYQHEFAKNSRPVLAASSDGNRLYLIAGSYKFTARGIVDR